MNYSESKPDFCFAINSASDFNFDTESESKSDSSSALMNLDICIFLLCIYTLLNKPADSFSFPFS